MLLSLSRYHAKHLILISILFAGIPLDTVLEVFGEYFVQYCFRHGYDQLLRTLGKDFISFIQNLDALHANLQRTYTKLRPPSFRCVFLLLKSNIRLTHSYIRYDDKCKKSLKIPKE